MRSQTFEDLNPCFADIFVFRSMGQDPKTGDELPPEKEYFAQGAKADLQPKSGTERIAASGTIYESSHVLFLPKGEQMIPQGAKVIITDAKGQKLGDFEITFAALYGTHWQLELKVV